MARPFFLPLYTTNIRSIIYTIYLYYYYMVFVRCKYTLHSTPVISKDTDAYKPVFRINYD